MAPGAVTRGALTSVAIGPVVAGGALGVVSEAVVDGGSVVRGVVGAPVVLAVDEPGVRPCGGAGVSAATCK